MINQFLRLKDNLPPVRDGVALTIMMGVGISSLLENAVVNVTKRMYNDDTGLN